MNRVKVGIVCGGKSSEHEISCISAAGVLSAIDLEKYEPLLIGITKSGKWVLPPASYPLTIQGDVLPEIKEDLPETSIDKLNIDLLFPVLHGPYGEDGTFQGQCEMAGIKYVGSGVLASAAGMDKSFAKPIFASYGMKVAEGFTITAQEWADAPASIVKQASSLSYPVFVKPARGGSSRGTSKVKSESELAAAINDALTFDSKVMIENAVVGSEIECAVLEINGKPQASTVGKISIDSKFEFYDFQAKYLDGATTIELPAPIPADVAASIQEQAIAAFKALDCRGLARVDFFLTANNEIIINELNTMPGFTATSVFPKMWQSSGVSYSEVITHLLEGAR
jgi:D-alanine-D-alanine ligase